MTNEKKPTTLKEVRCICFECADDSSRTEEFPSEVHTDDIQQSALNRIAEMEKCKCGDDYGCADAGFCVARILIAELRRFAGLEASK